MQEWLCHPLWDLSGQQMNGYQMVILEAYPETGLTAVACGG